MKLLIPFLLCIIAAEAQEASPPTFRSGSREVLVDAVVRDRNGKLVHGLTAADFEVLEDGNPQQVLLVREDVPTASGQDRIAGGKAPARAQGDQSSPSDPLQRLQLVALVFDRVGPDTRRLARQAALDVLKTTEEPNTHFGVFLIQNTLRILQTYTSDRVLLKAAVERATGGAKLEFAGGLTGMRSVVVGTVDPTAGLNGATALSLGGGGVLAGGPTDAGTMAANQMARVMADMNQLSNNSDRDQEGRASLYSLLALANALERSPGRKTVLYFSEGLQLPNSVWHVLQSVVGMANRGNISFYSVDTRGLSTANDMAPALSMLEGAGAANRTGLYNSSSGGAAVSRVESMAADTGLDAIRANPQMAMKELAESTGGFLAANTNDLRVPLRRALEEMSSYYELVYRPSNNVYNGAFRRISVRVKRSGLSVRARDGYFAFPPEQMHALFPYEVPLLRAITERPLPREVEYRAAAFRFRPDSDSVQTALVVQTPLAGLTLTQDEKTKRYRTHISTVTLLKGSDGNVAAKLARDLPLEIPSERVAEFKRGEFIVMQEAYVPAGYYTLESAIADREGDRVGARRSAVSIPPQRGGVVLSSLVLVRRVDQSTKTDLKDPFQVTGGRVVPWLTDVVERQPNQPVVVYFTIYPMELPGQKPAVSIEILADDVPVAVSRPSLPEPLDDGSIRYVVSAPSEKLASGLYEIRVRTDQAGTSATESLMLTIR